MLCLMFPEQCQEILSLRTIDKDGEITSDDQIIFDKTADPELTYGFTFNLGYKNWSLRGLIQGAGSTMREYCK